MFYVNRTIRTQEDGAAFVRICEENFQCRLNQLVNSVIADDLPELITLSGPTCSGKTTTAKKLTAEISAAGKNAVVLSIDDFFHERASAKLVGNDVDFDTVAAIDLPYLSASLGKMLRGEKTDLPHYDFKTGKRGIAQPYISTPDDIIILEGIQAVYPEVTALLANCSYKSIFINVTEDVTVNNIFFSKTDVRLARRIVRDFRFRSASPEYTLDIWENVRNNEEENIFPYMNNCDYIINSMQPYELFMIGQFAIPLLESVPYNSPHAEQAAEMLEKFRALRGNEIAPECLAADSLYHEFLG